MRTCLGIFLLHALFSCKISVCQLTGSLFIRHHGIFQHTFLGIHPKMPVPGNLVLGMLQDNLLFAELCSIFPKRTVKSGSAAFLIIIRHFIQQKYRISSAGAVCHVTVLVYCDPAVFLKIRFLHNPQTTLLQSLCRRHVNISCSLKWNFFFQICHCFHSWPSFPGIALRMADQALYI